MYYRDPDGNNIETQCDSFEDNDEATEFMKGENFKQNPIGTDFNPEEMIRKLEEDNDWQGWRVRTEIGKRGIDSVPTPA